MIQAKIQMPKRMWVMWGRTRGLILKIHEVQVGRWGNGRRKGESNASDWQ